MKRRQKIMLVDGYNLIGANRRLTEEGRLSLEYAREELLTILSEYQAVSKYDVICVFDAYEVKSKETVYDYHGVQVVFTKEKETADEYIERFVYKYFHPHLTEITVVTSDLPEQNAIFSYGAYRIPSREMWEDLKHAEKNISVEIEAINQKVPKTKLNISDDILAELEKLRRGKR